MVILATPDFGSSAIIVYILLITWAVVLLIVSVGIIRGMILLDSESHRRRKRGALLILVSGLVPFLCCLGPPHVVRLVYGNYPIGRYPNNKIREGMTTDEVAAILGPPHERMKSGGAESWYYWIDSFGMGWFGVRFGSNGRVIGTHGN